MPLVLGIPGWVWRLFCRLVFGYAAAAVAGLAGLAGHAGRLLARILFGLRYHDVACPFRLIRRDIFARIPIQSDSPFVHVEILAKANFLACLMAEEVPLPLTPRPYEGDFRLQSARWQEPVPAPGLRPRRAAGRGGRRGIG